MGYDKWGLDALVQQSMLQEVVSFERDPQQLPGYVHRTTLGQSKGLSHCKPVPDKAAKVHVLTIPAADLEAQGWNVLTAKKAQVTIWVQSLLHDKEIEAVVLDLLRQHAEGLTALELKKAIYRDPPIEICQINRVLQNLSLQEGAEVEKGAPREGKSKPVWNASC